MTTGALILFVGSCLAVACFGLYIGLRHDNDDNKDVSKQKHIKSA